MQNIKIETGCKYKTMQPSIYINLSSIPYHYFIGHLDKMKDWPKINILHSDLIEKN